MTDDTHLSRLEAERRRRRDQELDALMARYAHPRDPIPDLGPNVVRFVPRPRNTQQTSTGDDAA